MPRKVLPLGKKAQANEDARTAHHGTRWEGKIFYEDGKKKSTPKVLKAHAPWNLSCPDWERRLLAGESLIPDLPLFESEAERAVDIFNMLRLHDVIGSPEMGEASGAWLRDAVRTLFGSLDPDTMQRMIRELFLLVAKKNNKTTGGALLMLTALIMNRRPRAKFLFIGPAHDTAQIAFDAAQGAILLDPVLEKIFHIRAHLKTIEHRVTGASLQILTFDPNVLTGQKCCGVLLDELHEAAKSSRARGALMQLRGGMLPFPEAFMVFITTQSMDAPAGVFREELIKAREIRDGKRKGTMLPVTYEFTQKMQQDPAFWRNPKNWPLVSPNAGLSVDMVRLLEKFDEAQATGEEALRTWASQHLNVEIGLALHSARWAGADYWEGCARRAFTLTELIAACEVVCVGVDGGGLEDLLGFCAIGRHKATGEWWVWTHAWAHPKVLEKYKSESARLMDFAAEGTLTIVQEFGDDTAQVAGLVAKVYASGKLHQVGVDEAGGGAISKPIFDAGVPEGIVFRVNQGWRLYGAIIAAERRLAEGKIVHGGQALMNWCVGNAKIEPKGNAALITKSSSGKAKIDPLLAMLNAVTLMSLNPEAPGQVQVMFV